MILVRAMDFTRLNIICIFSIIFIFSFVGVRASSALGVGGAIFNYEIAPGGHISHEMVVSIDRNDPPIDIEVEVVGFGQLLDGGNMELKKELDMSPYSARTFLNVSPTSFHLKPGESQKVLLEGYVPANVGDGGRYAIVYLHSLPQGEGKIGVILAIDVPVLLTIQESPKIYNGEITNITLEKPVSGKSINVSIIYKNTGNYHYKALAEVLLMDEADNVLSRNATPLTFSSIIPSCSRIFKLSLSPNDTLMPGTYYVNSIVKLDNGTILDSKKEKLQSETKFEVEKSTTNIWILICLIVVILILVSYILWRIRRARAIIRKTNGDYPLELEKIPQVA